MAHGTVNAIYRGSWTVCYTGGVACTYFCEGCHAGDLQGRPFVEGTSTR